MKISDVPSALNAAQLSVSRVAPAASAPEAPAAGGEANLASPPAAFSKAQLEAQIDATNEQLKQSDEQLSFKLHEGTHQMVVRLIDGKTEQVLKEFPSEHFLDVVADLMKVAGLQVDETR